MTLRRRRLARAFGCLVLTSGYLAGAFACSSERRTGSEALAVVDAGTSERDGGDGARPYAPPVRPKLVCPGDDAGSTCLGINFPPCCSPTTGRCGEINPFVDKCFEYSAPGSLNFNCPAFNPPQGGLLQPGCCQPDSNCGYYSEFVAALPSFSYGCGNVANYVVPGQVVTPQQCPIDPCKTVLFDINLTSDPADGTHFLANTAAGSNAGVAGIVHMNLHLDKLAQVPDASAGLPNIPFYAQADAGSSDFKEAPFAIRLIEPADGAY